MIKDDYITWVKTQRKELREMAMQAGVPITEYIEETHDHQDYTGVGIVFTLNGETYRQAVRINKKTDTTEARKILVDWALRRKDEYIYEGWRAETK